MLKGYMPHTQIGAHQLASFTEVFLSPSLVGIHCGSRANPIWSVANTVFLKGISLLAAEVSRNDSCSDLPEIQNGWKTTSHTELVREAKITYQCDPGYDIVGSDTLTCQWDLSWSSDLPFCEKSTALMSFSTVAFLGSITHFWACSVLVGPGPRLQQEPETYNQNRRF